MILSPPVFPSQDGPMHVYHAHVFRGLLTGAEPYQSTFQITQFLPPYSLFLYALMALNLFFDPLLSEKLLVCTYLILFACGFRYLVRSLQPSAFVAPLFAFPLVMHRFAFMGFYNFILGAALALALAGYWVRYHNSLTWKRSVGFLVLIALLTLTHPLGLLTVLGFIGLHTGIAILSPVIRSPLRGCLSRAASSIKQHRRQLAHLAVFPLSLAWIAMYSMPSDLAKPQSEAGQLTARVIALLGGWMISPFQALEYRALLVAVVGLILLLAYRSLEELGESIVNALPLLLLGLGCTAVYFFVAGDIFFADRFPIIALPYFAAFAGARKLEGWPAAAIAVGVTAISILLLTEQFRLTRAVAREIEPVLSAPLTPGAQVVVAADTPYESTGSLMYSPYFWAGAHYARRSQGVLINYAWLAPKSPIMTFYTRRTEPWHDSGPFEMMEYLQKPPGPLPPATALVMSTTRAGGQPDSNAAARLGLHRQLLAGEHLSLFVK